MGGLAAYRADKTHKAYYQRQIENGGILIWVRIVDKRRLLVEIMKRHSGRDVHVRDWGE